MAFRFQRSVKLLPGVRLNFSKSGIGASFGVPGARYSISPTGRRTITTGIPGTGMSWRQSVGPTPLRGSDNSGLEDSTYAQRMTPKEGPGCFSVSGAVIGVLMTMSGAASPSNFAVIVTGLCIATASIGTIILRVRENKANTGIDDDRAEDGPDRDKSSTDIPDTLDDVIASQQLYEPIWEAYNRAKRGEGGDVVNGMPLEPKEVAIYQLSGELFEPSKGLDSISGRVIVTNQRIIFDSAERIHEFVLAKLVKISVTGPGQRVFAIKGRTKNHGLLFADHVNVFDNALGLALHLSNPRFTPESPEPVFEEYLRKLAAKRAELERRN